MSLEKTFVDMAEAARGSGVVLVYAPVTVNVTLGGTTPDTSLGDLLKSLAATVGDQAASIRAASDPRYQAWLDDRERRQAEVSQTVKKDSAPAEGPGLPEILKEGGFIGQVSQQKLVEKAAELELNESVAHSLWRELDANQELRKLCAEAGITLEVGRNNMYRLADLRKIPALDGLASIRGFGRNSQKVRLLKEL